MFPDGSDNPAQVPAGQGGGYGATPQTILVVDDELSMLEIASLILEGEGYHVLQATSAKAALSLLEESRPDLIVSDVMMSGMDGFDFCQRVRAKPKWSQTPFIFLTGRDKRADVRRGMGLGADDYLVKPFEPEELLAAVRVRLARASETQAALGKATADLRDTIMRTLSHEFRTPLLLVVGYTDLLESGAQEMNDGEFHEFLGGLRQGSERLMNLVEDFLLLIKLETGALAQEGGLGLDQSAEADAVVSSVVERFESQAQARNVSLGVHPGAPQAMVAANEQSLKEIVSRLVGNAIKFSKKKGGQVILTTRQDEGLWVLDVADEGIGIRQDALDWVFESFRQVDRHRMEQQGAGLGLAIVRALTELYGGRVEVESEPGSGSTFTIRLPLAAQ